MPLRKDLTRRRLLQNALLATSGLALGGLTGSRVLAAPGRYQGKLVVTLQLNGGVDVTSFCDPKVNTPGEPKINHWADNGAPLQAGKISFAPFANNETFFNKYKKDMLVVNGVDAQTNSHTTGILYNWSGRNSQGSPSITALHAAKNSPEQPLAYTTLGGFSQTGGLIRFTRINDINNVRSLLAPNINPWDGEPSRPEAETTAVKNYIDNSLEGLAASSISPRQMATMSAYVEGRNSRQGLASLLDILPPQEDMAPDVYLGTPNGWSSDLLRRIQGALLIFKAGLGSAADLELGGFDSHDANDQWQDPLLSFTAEAVDFFWSYAEELGLADRITLLIGSDFGRTNYYNDADGKDHWPIGSYIVMEKNPAWGNRVVGLTDELHFPVPINPSTLKKDVQNGVNVLPSHVHLALRKHLNLDKFAKQAGFPLDVQSMPLFDASKGTV
ncbi:MAG: DUF1501 domain-containing protein [Halioglobus sp.]